MTKSVGWPSLARRLLKSAHPRNRISTVTLRDASWASVRRSCGLRAWPIVTVCRFSLCIKHEFRPCGLHMYLHTHIYIGCEVIIWSEFGGFGSYYLVQVCFSKTPIAKNTIEIVVSAHFLETLCAKKNWKLLSGPSWRFLRRTQLGPDNNFQLGSDNNFQKCHFLIFCFGNVLKYLFLQCFWKQEKSQKMPNKKR